MEPKRIVLYDNEGEVFGDPQPGDVVPVIRGNGPREGELMGMGTITEDEDGLSVVLDPADSHRN